MSVVVSRSRDIASENFFRLGKRYDKPSEKIPSSNVAFDIY